MSSEFNASVFVSEQLNRQMVNMIEDVAHRCVMKCASRYGFNGEEAIRSLNLSVKMEHKKGKKVSKPKEVIAKAAFPLPYNGEMNELCCFALRQNNGLYTQCTSVRKGDAKYCKGCSTTMQKTGAEVPEYGTIQQRQAVGIFEYVDPKGRKPVAYAKVMKKYKINKKQVLEEAGKINMIINPGHFVVPEESVKRGRPASQKGKKVKGTKGRPKKSKKVLEIEGEEDDLFASLVAQANEVTEEETEAVVEEVTVSKKKGKTDEEKEAERLAKEAEKAEKEKKRLAEKAEKEAKLALEKAEKEAKKEAERLAKEAKLALEKAEKEAKKEAERLAKEAKKKADEEEKAAKKAALEEAKKEKKEKKAEEKPEETDEQDVVKKIEIDGKKYLKSKKTSIIYDYLEYTKNGEQVVIGKWNDSLNKIVFDKKEDEEEEEEYDM
jgi:hypothetical protein